MKTYCVKQKKETLCVPNSIKYKTTKHGRLMMSCTCAECGITKTRFVKSKKGSGYSEDWYLRKLYGGDIKDWYPMEMYTDVTDPTNPLYEGGKIDIHKMIGKLPRPKAGLTPSKYKYMGPYNPLDKQLEYDKNTGKVTKWHVQPYNKVDEIAAHRDICYDMGKSKGECDKKMVESLDEIPYGEMPKWGKTARFLINTKQKLGLGVKKPKNVRGR